MEERISGWLAKVPGYTGYRSKENRRDEDKEIRVAIARQLDQIVDRLTRTGSRLAADRNFALMTTVESALADTRHLGDRIRNASYGYGGIFTENGIDELALEQLRQFDLALQRQVATLGPLADAVKDDATVAAYREKLDTISTLVQGRGDVVDQGKPSNDARTLALLNQPVEQKPSPLLDVTVGDALSVLGDNFTADATITLRVNDATVKLIRISGDTEGSERWLMGSSSSDVWPSADLTEASTSTALVPTTTPSPASMSLSGPQGTESNIPVSYAYSREDTAISLEINVGGEARFFTGKVLNDIDVEIYGSTGSTR